MALLLALPSLRGGFFSDDSAMLAFLDGHVPSPPWFDLYRFVPGGEAGAVLREVGQVPWWSAPDLRVHLVRPLASALLALDHVVFGASPVGYHVVSLAWYAALLFVVRAIFRRVLEPATATLALLLYAFSGANAAAFGWISARHGLVAAVPALLGLVAHLKLREEAWRPGRWLAPLGMAVGLLGSEAAMGVLAMAVAYDVVGPAAAREPISVRVKRAIPLGALAVAYLALYALVGGGTHGSAGYLSPLDAPVGFVVVAIRRVPVLLGNAIVGIPSELSNAGFEVPLACIGLVATLLAYLAWRACAPLVSDRERITARWTLVGALLAILVSVGGFPGARVLVVPDLGFASLFACFLRYGFAPGRLAVVRRAWGGLLVALHLVLAPLGTVANLGAFASIGKATDAAADDARAAIGPATRVFLAAGSDPMIGMYVAPVLANQGARLHCWSWLDAARTDTRITRNGPSTIVIEPIGSPLITGPFEILFRSAAYPFHVGDEATTCGAVVRILAMNGDRPSRIEVAIDGLGGPDVAVLAWQAGAVHRLVLPAPGESTVVPWSAGPTGLF